MLRVHETFISYQGEGPMMGVPSLFVRLQGCNLACSWCDSKPAVINCKSSGEECNAEMLLIEGNYSNLVITGGEPLLQQDDPEFAMLVNKAIAEGYTVEIETNGTMVPDFDMMECCQFNVSPKLYSSGMQGRTNPEAILEFSSMLHDFKFVIDLDEVDPFFEIKLFQVDYGVASDYIWVMAEATTPDQVMKGTSRLMQMDHRYNVATRGHILFGVK